MLGAKVQRVLRTALVAAGLLLTPSALAADLSGIVTEMQDIGTLTLLSGQTTTYRIRLNDIDAPEVKASARQGLTGKPFGPSAARSMRLPR